MTPSNEDVIVTGVRSRSRYTASVPVEQLADDDEELDRFTSLTSALLTVSKKDLDEARRD